MALFPLDADARAARERVLEDRNKLQRERDELMVRRYRRGLPKHINAILDRAEMEDRRG